MTVIELVKSQECTSYVTCSQCITMNESCAWCNDEKVFQVYADDVNAQLIPAELCGTIDELSIKNCTNIINPQGYINDGMSLGSNEGSGIPSVVVSPDSVNVLVRPGIPQSFTVTVKPPESISVDMYVLMDLTQTMAPDLANLQNFGVELVEQMQNLTDEFRIAFGSFIDKPVSPFVDRLNPDNPCFIDGDVCDPAYAYQHHLNFTSDGNLFTTALNNASLSASSDDPEALLDAMLQVAVCEAHIGWKPATTTRRIILALTDGDYHTALDGRLAGIFRRPTAECRLDSVSNLYEYGNETDYPSSYFLTEILNQNRIIPIFAVTNNVNEVYRQLAQIIRSAFVGEVTDESANLLSILRDQYRILSTTIVPVISGIDEISGLSIAATPLNNCGSGNIAPDSNDTCENIEFPQEVTYDVTVDVLPEFCESSAADSSLSARLLFIGFGDVQIYISVICSCDCENNSVVNSSRCSDVGTFECSTCVCPETRVGPVCGCSTAISVIGNVGCIPRGSNDTDVCSDKGDCVCDMCQCHPIPLLVGRIYQGDYCECNPFACPRGTNENGDVLVCADHGICGCDSQCICDDNYSGLSCECSNTTDTCIQPGAENGTICSGVGECRCGACVCDDYSERVGLHCEICVACTSACSELMDCVRCYIEENCDDECSNTIVIFNDSDFPNFNSSLFGVRECSVTRDNCEVVYELEMNVLGTENETIYIYIDDSQQDYREWRNNPNDCRPDVNFLIYVIPIAIVIGIVLLVILVLATWKGILYLGEYAEYRQWEQSQRNEEWNQSGDNPIFVDPTAKYNNPKYRRPVQLEES